MTDWKEPPPREQLEALRSRATLLADELESAAVALQTDGEIPSAELAAALEALHRDFRQLMTRLDPEDRDRESVSWDAITRCILRREQQSIVTPLLRQTAQLSHRSLPQFEPLRTLQDSAAELQQRIDAGQASAEEISPYLSDEHGLAALIRLVHEGDDLTDEQWESLRAAVERDLGRPLALAAVRNQLQLTEDFVPGDSAILTTSPGEGLGLADDSLFSEDDPLGLPLPLSDEERQPESKASTQPHRAPPHLVVPLFLEAPASPASSVPEPTAEVVADVEAEAEEAAGSVFDDFSPNDSERRRLARIELPPVEPPVPASLVEELTEAEVSEPVPNDSALFDDEPVRSDDDATKTAGTTQSDLEQAPRAEPTASTWFDPRDRRSQALLVTSELQALARAADQSTGLSRDRLLAELVWRLLYDGLPDIAWQLARAVHRFDTRTQLPTPETVRLWLIGHRITSEDRQLLHEYARTAETLANVDDEHPIHQTNHPEQDLALAGLLRGAALIPDSSASQLLQRLAEDSGQDVLSRYVSTVRRLAEHDSEFLRVRRAVRGDADPSALAQHQLHDDIALWFDSRSRDAVGFQRAEALFVRPHWSVNRGTLQREPYLSQTIGSWLHVQRLVHALLQPALDDDRGAVTDVRNLANRVQNKLMIGDAADYPPGCDKILVPRKDMADYLRQACELAQRWVVRGRLDLDAASSPETHTLDALRREFDRLQSELVDTLQAQALRTCDLPQQTALGCLLLSVEQLAEAIQSERGPLGREWSVAEVQTAHLRGLRVTAWDQAGLPVCEEREFIDRVLLALAESQVRVVPAKEQHGLDADDSPCGGRSQSGSECEELAEALQQALDEGLLSPHDHAAFNARLLAMQCGDRIGGISAERRMWLEDLERRLRTRGLVKSKGAVPRQEAAARDIEAQRSESVLLDD